jgi:RNA polymerase sigma factor (sigma-70 family)
MPRTWRHAADAATQQEFLDRYEQLLVWALKLTGRQQADAHDLVQEAFIAYATGQRDEEIKSLNGYLYGILRNLLRADRRRAEQRRRAPWASAEATPGALRDQRIDPATHLEARQTLVHIARFARARSRESKTGSVLLLRYFHGYAPREIAQIMGVPASNVDDWLKLGRREARAAAATPAVRAITARRRAQRRTPRGAR